MTENRPEFFLFCFLPGGAKGGGNTEIHYVDNE